MSRPALHLDMTANFLPRRAAGAPDSSGGQFAPTPRAEKAPHLIARPPRQAREWIESRIASGELSPSAREMDPRDVIEQHAEACAVGYREKADWYEDAGLMMRVPASEIQVYDRVDLEALAKSYGPVEPVPPDPVVDRVAEIEWISAEYGSGRWDRILHTDQGSITVPHTAEVEYLPAVDCENRCAECGSDSSDGELCVECEAERLLDVADDARG